MFDNLTAKDVLYIVGLIGSVGTLYGVMVEHNRTQDKKIAQNCDAITDLKKENLMSEEAHRRACMDRMATIEKADKIKDEMYQRRFQEGKEEFKAIRDTQADHLKFMSSLQNSVTKLNGTIENLNDKIERLQVR